MESLTAISASLDTPSAARLASPRLASPRFVWNCLPFILFKLARLSPFDSHAAAASASDARSATVPFTIPTYLAVRYATLRRSSPASSGTLWKSLLHKTCGLAQTTLTHRHGP